MSAGGAELDATGLAAAVAAGERTARDAVDEALARAAADPFGCFVALAPERARERAAGLDRDLAERGARGPLHGVPVAIKANLCARGHETSCGSRLLAGYRAPYDATAVERLEAAGAVVIGTTRMDEFGMGSTGETCASGATVNPRSAAGGPALVPGGSSSGSAAAVASGVVPLALGSDTGGSVRQPAAFCGVFGFKPTWGRVSRHGLVAFASSLDTVGPIARSARDLELAIAVTSGPDGRDATAFAEPVLGPPVDDGLRGARVGVLGEAALEGVDDAVRQAFELALDRARGLGAEVVEVELPHAAHGVAVYYVVATAEASSNLARFDGVRYGVRVPGADPSLEAMMTATRSAGFGDEVVRRVLMGTHALSSGFYEAWFDRAARVRRLVARDHELAFGRVDLIATPTAPTQPFPLGAVVDPLVLYRGDALTIPPSLAGLPAASVPTSPGATVGVQIVGPSTADARVLAAARTLAPEVVPTAGEVAR